MDRFFECENPTMENVKKIIDQLVENGEGQKVLTVFNFSDKFEPIEGLLARNNGTVEITGDSDALSFLIDMDYITAE